MVHGLFNLKFAFLAASKHASIFSCKNPSLGCSTRFIKYSYAFSKRKNSSGKEFYVYDQSTRKYGTIMFYLGISIFGLILISTIFK